VNLDADPMNVDVSVNIRAANGGVGVAQDQWLADPKKPHLFVAVEVD
jgi:hypothetical protein